MPKNLYIELESKGQVISTKKKEIAANGEQVNFTAKDNNKFNPTSNLTKNANGTWDSKIYKLTLMMEDVAPANTNSVVIGTCDLDVAKFVNSDRQALWAKVQDVTHVVRKPTEVFLKGDKSKYRDSIIGFKISVTPDLSTAKPVGDATPVATPPRSQPGSARNMTSQESAAKRIV